MGLASIVQFRRYAWLVILVVVAGAWNAFFATAGTFRAVQPSYYYHELAQGFADGHAYLRMEPNPALLALHDPYDPLANKPYRLHDAILFNQRYYLQWGPVPALFLTPFAMMHVNVPDAFLTWLFFTALAGVWGCAVAAMRTAYFPGVSRGTTALVMILGAAAHPFPYMLARPSIYEASIAGGQFFVMLGLLLGWLAVRDGQRRLGLLLLTGLCLALGAGTRVSLTPAVGVICIILTVALFWRQPRSRWRGAVVGMFLLGLPVAVGQGLLAYYNYARFGSISEVGVKYILVGGAMALWKYPPGTIFSWQYILPNLWSHLFRAPVIEAMFPFLHMQRGTDTTPWLGLIQWPRYMDKGHWTTGLFFATPFLIFMPAGVLWALKRACGAGIGSPSDAAEEQNRSLYKIALCLILIAGAAGLPALCLLGATPRYEADVFLPLLMVAVLFWWRVISLTGVRPRIVTFARFIGKMLALVSILFAFLYAFSAEFRHFRRHNPTLYAWLVERTYVLSTPRMGEVELPIIQDPQSDRQFIRLANQAGEIPIFSPRAGTIILQAAFVPGKDAPTGSTWQMTIASDERTEVLEIHAGVTEFSLQAKAGMNSYMFSVVDTFPEVSSTANILMLNVQEMRLVTN